METPRHKQHIYNNSIIQKLVERRGIEPLSETFLLDAFYSNFLCHLTHRPNRNQTMDENPHVMLHKARKPDPMDMPDDEFPTQAPSGVRLFR